MKAAKIPKRRQNKQRNPEKAITDLRNSNEPNPAHRRDFDQLLDDAILGAPKKKKTD